MEYKIKQYNYYIYSYRFILEFLSLENIKKNEKKKRKKKKDGNPSKMKQKEEKENSQINPIPHVSLT